MMETPADSSRGAGLKRRREDSRELESKHIKIDSALEEESERKMADPTISVTGVTGGNVGTSITGGIIHVTAPDELADMQDTTADEVKRKTTGMVRVSTVNDVATMIVTDQPWVTITGNAGDGKTTLGCLLLKEFMQKKFKVFTLYDPAKYDLISKIKEEMVIMFDDRFGAFGADENEVKKWIDVVKRLTELSETDKQKTKVIFIIRKNVLKESKDYLERLGDIIFATKCVVDLSKRTELMKERLEILEYHLHNKTLKIDDSTKLRVCAMTVAHGFPHCCKMFSELQSEGNDIDIVEFFKSPLKFLDNTTRYLYTTQEHCKTLFKLMIKMDGQVGVHDIENENIRENLIKAVTEQEGSYINKLKNGLCQFAHPSVYESVLNVINAKDPRYCVQYASLSVIRQKMIISTSDEEDRRRSPCYIIVEPIPAVLKTLAERFREEILKGDYSVYKHRLCRSREFCEALVSCCVTTDERENGSKQFINQPGEDGATMLCTAARNRRLPAVHCLVKADADVNIQDKRGRTPLHYLCQLKKTTEDDDDDNGDDDDNLYPVDLDTLRLFINKGRVGVNICDQYGKTPFHYLCQIRNSISPAVKHKVGKLQNVVIEAIRLFLIDGRGDVNIGDQYRQTPLHYLCQFRNSAAADGHHDDKLNDVVTNAIRLIIIKGNGDINNPDEFRKTPLHYLFKSCTFTTEEIQWIITQGKGDLNKCEQHESTPLHYLCANSSLQLDTLDLVIKEGKGDFNKGDEHGTTPLHHLCENGKLELDVVLQIVNTANGDINKQDDSGITPLHVLCKGSLPMKNILTLINQGDKADRYGNTPLHYLCRRRGINAEVLQQQLEQIPETDLKKQNNLGYTPLDYLTDQDNSLPWTDGMIARSAADLVLCRLKHGEDWIYVLGRAMILNSERVHRNLQVEDFGRVLTNLERSGDRKSPGQFSEFCGTCSNPVPPSPSPLTTPASYWETSSTLTQRQRVALPLLEMGLKLGRRNKGWYVSRLPHSVCVSVTDICPHHLQRLCIQVRRRDQEDSEEHQVGECVSQFLPTPGVEFTLTFGLVLDVGRGRVGFIDVKRGQLLCKVDLQMKEEVSPMFHVYPNNNFYATRMRLVSGREICVTDRKIHLIQQVLSN